MEFTRDGNDGGLRVRISIGTVSRRRHAHQEPSHKLALDPEVHAHWGLVDFEATGIAGTIPVYKSNWTVRAGVRAYREVAHMNRPTRLDALFSHTPVPAILSAGFVGSLASSLDACPCRKFNRAGG
jgi:hypothetical protein